ncbi:MAG TPA: EamA family transporter [Candidatus Limnocylindria bacterium]|nr:EamA family transporter [Candidatus Limnocylindria bacterium]
MASQPPANARPDGATLVAFIAVTVLGGANAIAVKQTLGELEPLWSAAIRFVPAGVLMTVVVLIGRRAFPRGRSLQGAALYGFFGFTASYGLIYTGMQEVPAGTTMVLVSLTPLYTFGLAIAHRQERFHVRGLLGAVVAAIGIAIVFADQLSADVPLINLLLIMLGAAAIAEAGVIVKWIPRSDPFGTNAVAMLVGGVLLTALSLLAGDPRVVPAATGTWLALAYLVVLGSVVMFALYVFALQRWTASAVSYVTLLMPLVTVAFGILIGGESITTAFVLGAAVILVGVYVGAFTAPRPHRSSASSLPECLPSADASEAAIPQRTESGVR